MQSKTLIQGSDDSFTLVLTNSDGSSWDSAGVTAIQCVFKGNQSPVAKTLASGAISVSTNRITVTVEQADTLAMHLHRHKDHSTPARIELIIDKGSSNRKIYQPAVVWIEPKILT